ncbi:Glutamate or tyrosine decarboxylase [Reichenbachiella faecimaris]|uniref:Glutamate or tyrosine decarboxylase n=1 Tax=Reichenbachiella faecimaris TaxID=692418 RepID=A0A1W2GGS3_REIFA|nr:pyridoxal-dependent decarboxylase [Reichenbachiella faecimaris]SMD35863.1 Glutamate or tyrosine decarboxylase [Reichenbachiella faecimaris]
MNNLLKQDLDEIHDLMNSTLREGLNYLDQINELPTSVKVEGSQSVNLDELGMGGKKALSEFNQRFKSLMVASTGPRYWGFVTGGATPAALMGDVLATIYDQNTQTDKGHGDVSALIEFETIQLLLDLFDLPKDYLGGFVTGATMSNFSCLAVGRQWLGKQKGIDIAKEGISGQLKVLAATPHSSAIKSLAMLGMGSANLIKVGTLGGTREAIDMEDLKHKIDDLNGEPFILITSGGTVNTVDFDDFEAIAQLRKKHNFWWHIDAAFGGFAVLSPAHDFLLKGWEHADSLTIDGHKWLNVPYESAFFFIKEKHKLSQVEAFQNSNAPYLGDPLDNFNYLNFLPENSRRFKALAAWFTLKAYGKEGHKEIITRNIKQTQQLGSFVENSKHFELLAPVRLNTVCFTLRGESDAARVNKFLNELNDTGKVFMTPTVFNGRSGIRAALVNWRTTDEDVLLVWQLMQQTFEGI